MKLTEFMHQLAERFAPMSERSAVELQQKGSQEHTNVLNSLEAKRAIIDENRRIQSVLDKGIDTLTDAEQKELYNKIQPEPKFTIAERIVGFCETWYARYLLAALFVWVQPKIQAYLNPPPAQEPPYEE